MQRFALYFKHFYRPQRSWDKVMFLQVSLILFTEGRWWYSSMHCRWYPSMPPCSRSRGGGGGVGWYPSMSFRFPGSYPGEVEGSDLGGLQAHTWGVSRPTPGGGLQAPHRGLQSWGLVGIPACLSDFQAHTQGGS